MNKMKNTLYIPDEKLSDFGESTARTIKPEGFIKGRVEARGINQKLRTLAARRAGAEKFGADACAADEWLLDNFYLARREGKFAQSDFNAAKKLPAAEGESIVTLLCGALVSAGNGEITPERCGFFLEGAERVYRLTQTELALFPAALRAALIAAIAESCGEEDSADVIAAAFTSLRLISTCDLSEVLNKANLVEQTLCRDPAGVYPLMDEESRGAYRERVAALAKRDGTGEYETAQRVLELAEKEGENPHVGYYLFTRPLGGEEKERRGGAYIAANVILTLFISLLFGFWEKSVPGALLLLLPVSELVKSFMDYIAAKCVKPRRVFRMELADGLPDDGRTVCVVSALLTSPEDGEKAAKRLEQCRLLSRDCGKNLTFGILADLKESATETDGGDDEIITAAKAAVEKLNEKYSGGFYLFTRKRSYNAADDKFMGYERKRGAVLALAKLLQGEDSELSAVGDMRRLEGAKYILTMDGDTRLLPGAAKALIGAMLHPLNTPVIDLAAGRVTAGYGVLHPRMAVELESAVATDFSRVFAGQGGTDPYASLCGEIYMDMFASGGFAGKGIIDVRALLACCGGLPENRILSHDALEGAYLRGGYMGDCQLTDGFPGKALAYFARLHRWTRGDWQNLPWIFNKGRGLRDIDRWKLFDSLRRSLVAPLTFAAIFAGFFIKGGGLAIAAAAALTALASRLLVSLAEGASRKTGETGVRYHSGVIYGVGGAIMQTFLRLWLLPYEAWVCVSAAAAALWRMTVSHRNLLQWQTAAQAEQSAGSLAAHFSAMWFSAAAGLACLLLSSSVIGAAAGLLWLTAPIAAWALSLPAKKSPDISKADRQYLTRCAGDIWAYFENFCSAEDNYLPPDNYQEQPPVGIAHRTSPTNIGLALVSCLGALDLGIDGGNTAMGIMENMLATVQKLPKWQGHLYNWYDTRTLRPLAPAYVSTVDSGNLYACLVCAKNGLLQYGRPDLSALVEKICADMDFSPLYDRARRLFYIGIDVKNNRPSNGWYDLMASEARLTSYIAVAKGDVPAKHWRRLSRALLQFDGYRGLASWTGTMFEYLMPELFLPLCPESLLYESARFCLYVQRRRVRPGEAWGISESAFFALDSALNYRYKANGCGALALKRGQDRELVVSPYSSFLALAVQPRAALRNLKRLAKLGMTCRWGFYEARDFTPARCRGGDGETVKCVMSHHQGMSMISAANCLVDGVMRRRFMADEAMSAYKCLLAERIPTGGVILRRDGPRTPEKSRRERGEKWHVRGEGADFENPACCVLSSGKYSMTASEYGLTASRFGDVEIYRAPETTVTDAHGVDVYFAGSEERRSLLPVPNDTRPILWEQGEELAAVSVEDTAFSSRCSAAVCSGIFGEMRFAELTAKEDLDGEIQLCFEPVLADVSDYEGHPAFWRLGLEAGELGGCLMLRRLKRGEAREMWLCLGCDKKMSFSADRNGGLGPLSAPYVRSAVPISLKAGESVSLRWALCLGASAAEAYAAAQRALTLGRADYADMPGACAALTGMTVGETGRAMGMIKSLWFPRTSGMCAKDMLWRYSVSGDLPIILCTPASLDDIDAPLKEFFLLRTCGMLCDLVFITDDGGDYSRPISRRIEDGLERCGLGPLLGSNGGVHILPREALDVVSSCAAVTLGCDVPARATDRRHFLHACGQRGGTPEYRWYKDRFSFNTDHRLPARCWANILTNGAFGYVAADCGLGHMWYRNSREMPINRWENDPYAVTGPETLDVLLPAGRFSLFAAGDGIPATVDFGFGWTRWRRDFDGFSASVTAFVPESADARVLIIETEGEAPDCTVIWKTGLALSPNADAAGAVSIKYTDGVFAAESSRAYYEGLRFLARASAEPEDFVCDENKYLHGEFDSFAGYSSRPVIAARFKLSSSLVIVCGCCGEGELAALCRWETVQAALESTKKGWDGIIRCFKLECDNAPLTRFMNGWCQYQTVACRLMARTSLYQSGGAFGFRDQLQDAVNLILISPKYARAQIGDACLHQYAEGDVMHWWHRHPKGDRGVRTRCSDDLLWLVWAVCEYAEKTGDLEICREEYDYIASPPLSDDEGDRYETPSRANMPQTVLQHAMRAVDRCVNRGVGPHGLLKFGSGDWNDGMDRVDGESVWLSWFFAHSVGRLAELLKRLDMPEADKYAGLSRAAGRAANMAWDGGWYLRGYWPGGEAIGSHKNRCCRIDSVAQSWAAMCDMADPNRVDNALENAFELLFDPEIPMLKLFDPPFADCAKTPGYIESYGGGFRENGGQYTHGAVWLAMALLRRGKTEDGMAVLNALLPENHDLEKFLAEPFVLPADVYSAPGRAGEAGWTWYTGSSGWYFRVVTEELLGIRLKNGALTVEPRLENYTAVLCPQGGERRTVTVKNGVAEIT